MGAREGRNDPDRDKKIPEKKHLNPGPLGPFLPTNWEKNLIFISIFRVGCAMYGADLRYKVKGRRYRE